MRLWLVDVPAGAALPDLAAARSLGPRGAIIARIKELLPGATFGVDNHGVFRRSAYQLTFRIDDEEPTRVEVDVDGGEGCVPLARVVEKTGWRVVDPDGPGFVDLGATHRAGAIVHVGQSDVRSGGHERGSDRWRWWTAAALVVLLGGWFAWGQSGHEPDQLVSEDGFAWPPQHIKQRHNRLDTLSPAFRDDRVVGRLIDFAIAEKEYQAGVGRGRYATPAHLGHAWFFRSHGVPEIVPPEFNVSAEGDYTLQFNASDCNVDDVGIPTDCESFVYVAVPKGPPPLGQSLPPGYALYSFDMRIRYRDRGGTPDLSDDTVDNGGASETHAEARPSWWGWLSRTLNMFRPATGAIEPSEAIALSDLRAVNRAEIEWRLYMRDTSKYMPPEQLADASAFAKAQFYAPLLPSRFLLSQRDGYEYEFIGEGLTISELRPDVFHPVYARFMYVARPTESGPADRRTFALSQDGTIFATKERRVPTSADTPVDAQ